MEHEGCRDRKGRAFSRGAAIVGIATLVALSMMLSVTSAGLSAGPSAADATTLHASLTEYPVIFTESGLPSGTSWSVTLNGTSQTSSTATIGFEEPNGSYVYYVAAVLSLIHI